MNPLPAKPAAAPLSASQRSALLTLLADEDPAVFAPVRARILAGGPTVRDWLQPLALSPDAVLRRHAREILQHLARAEADERFIGFCISNRGAEFDLEQALWLLAQTHYPDTNRAAYQALLDSHAADLRERFTAATPPRQLLDVLNRFFFAELGFRGDAQNYYDPDNSYLNRVMDRRRGNPISLCLVYLLIARRLHLPVVGIGLPGHFLCRFQNSAEEIYLDLFHGGRFLTKNDCIHHLIRTNQRLDHQFLNPASPHQILARVCANLHASYRRLQLAEETERLQSYLIALAR